MKEVDSAMLDLLTLEAIHFNFMDLRQFEAPPETNILTALVLYTKSEGHLDLSSKQSKVMQLLYIGNETYCNMGRVVI